MVTCTGATAHYKTGCDLLLHYANGDGQISDAELSLADYDWKSGILSMDEYMFIIACWKLPSPNVNNKCPRCYTPTAPFGDITKVTLDDKLLPEGGTLPWLLNDDAHVKVFFKNTGNVASAFRIWLTDETGTTITGCDITTSEIPADGAEYFADLCVFMPDVVKVKTLTAHIEP